MSLNVDDRDMWKTLFNDSYIKKNFKSVPSSTVRGCRASDTLRFI